jgi:SAM-dependent methyltransferase
MHENAYRDDLAYVHDIGCGDLARDAATRLVDELLRCEHRTGTVVDVGCGSGILAQAAADAGYNVLGIDVSAAMVSLARSRAPAAEFRIGSFVGAPLPTCVAVVAVGEVLSYEFDPANDDRTRFDWFKRVYDALRPGGVLLFDIAGPERAPSQESRRSFATGPDWAALVDVSIDQETGNLVRKITSFRQVGTLYRRDDEVHRLSLLEPAAVLTALQRAGFEAEIIPAYKSAPLPPGIVAFRGQRPATRAV